MPAAGPALTPAEVEHLTVAQEKPLAEAQAENPILSAAPSADSDTPDSISDDTIKLISASTKIDSTSQQSALSPSVNGADDDDAAALAAVDIDEVARKKGVGIHFPVYGDSNNGSDIGVPEPSTLKGYDTFYISFWLSNGGPADNVRRWADATPKQRAAMHKKYQDAGIKLCISAFGATDKPQTNGHTAKGIADRLGNFVKHYELDGVDIDYEEFNRFAQGRSTGWLCHLTRDLRKKLPSPKYIITHAPVAPWFSKEVYPKDGGYTYVNKQVGHLIDWYNIQFYNQGTYDHKDTLLWDSGRKYPRSSLFEIIKYGGIPSNKCVVGKPARAADADPYGDGYMRPTVLAAALKEAVNNGWKGGVMFWEAPYATASRLAVVKQGSGL